MRKKTNISSVSNKISTMSQLQQDEKQNAFYDFAEGVKFGLAFGSRYKQMEYSYSKLASDCDPLRIRLLSSQVNSLSSKHIEYMCDVDDAINSPAPDLKDVLNDIFDDMKHSKGAYIKLVQQVMDIKTNRAPKRKRKSPIRQSTLTPETVEEEDVESS